MKYYLDTEFAEDGERIDLISVGIVCEYGREYYAQSAEFDPSKASQWVQDNVFQYLRGCPYAKARAFYTLGFIKDEVQGHRRGKCVFDQEHATRHENFAQEAIMQGRSYECPWRTREQIRDEITAFLDPAQYGKPQFYTWCGTYDHVALCQLWGKMIDTPEWFPHHVHDLQSILEDHHISDDQLPQQEGTAHNAIDDARHLRTLWEYVERRK